MRTTFLTCIFASSLVLALNLKAEEISNSLGMKLVFISPGKFLMGSPECEPGREAQEVQHEVELTKGFYLGTHEVTVGQFKQFVADTKFQTDGERDGKGAYGINEAGKIEEMHAKFTWKGPGFEQTDEHPVVDVSWQDAKAFCAWLSQKEKKTYRLPTEAEWEHACRAGAKTAFAHSDDSEGLAENGNGADATARAKYPGWSIGIKGKDGYVFTAPVGQFKANAFGLYDMHGNVWEWCEDWYEPNSYPKEKQIDPTGPATGKAKVQRGGGWSSDSKRLRSAARVGRDQSAYRGCYLGLRVVLEKSPAEILKESGATQNISAGGRRGDEATIKLVEMVADGKFPGITDPADLWTEFNMHSNRHVLALTAYCNVATMYGASPIGLKPDFSQVTYGGGGKGPGIQSMEGITDEQRAILQKLAWDMVSKYPYAGIAKFEAPQPLKQGEKTAPVPAARATVVPEALKGWKATQDLPAETVVTDYNAYIEKLPKAERPGVSDVKYYVDDMGRSAVAVLVNVGGTQSTHLLIYDKQNKRTGLTKFSMGN